jgi:glutamate racemase
MIDSGFGGLTIYDELRALAPGLPVVYTADLAGLPYGDKSEAEIAARVCGLLGRLTERVRPRLACIACNTASTIALTMVRDVLEVPVVGTVPAIKPASGLTRSGVIGLLGTAATIRQPYVESLQAAFAPDKTLLRAAAPELVLAAEAKLQGRAVSAAAIESAIDRLRSQPNGDRMDTVVLACTHFPLVRQELAKGFGDGVELVDGARGIARRIVSLAGTDGATPARAIVLATGREDRLAPYRTMLSARGFALAQPV